MTGPADSGQPAAAPRGVISVSCLATLAAYRPENARAFPLSDPLRRVRDLLDALQLPAAKVTTILVNGAPGDLDTPLAPGDAVTLLPTISGG